MAIAVIVVEENLQTPVSKDAIIDSIEPNNDFYNLRNLAKQLNLPFISTIDDAGFTIINHLQRYPLEQEIKQLRNHPSVNQKILDILQRALDIANTSPHQYIQLIGD